MGGCGGCGGKTRICTYKTCSRFGSSVRVPYSSVAAIPPSGTTLGATLGAVPARFVCAGRPAARSPPPPRFGACVILALGVRRAAVCPCGAAVSCLPSVVCGLVGWVRGCTARWTVMPSQVPSREPPRVCASECVLPGVCSVLPQPQPLAPPRALGQPWPAQYRHNSTVRRLKGRAGVRRGGAVGLAAQRSGLGA